MYNKQQQRKSIKATINRSDGRKKRQNRYDSLRKKSRIEHMNKRRREESATHGTMKIDIFIRDTPGNVTKLSSPDIRKKIEGVSFFRKFLSIEGDENYEKSLDIVVGAGVVRFFVNFLMENSSELQFEALCVLTNICCGGDFHIKSVLKFNIVPILIKFISPKIEQRVVEQAVWTIGNIAGECSRYRDYVLNCGIMGNLLALLKTPNLNLSVVRNIIWTLSNLCGGLPEPKLDLVKLCIPYLAHLVMGPKDPETVLDACWALYFISNGRENVCVQAILDHKLVDSLVKMLFFPYIAVQTVALKIIGNIVSGTDEQTQLVIDNGGLISLKKLLSHEKLQIRIDAIFAIGNITGGNDKQIKSVYDIGIFDMLIKSLSGAEFQIQRLSAWAICNATKSGNIHQIVAIRNLGCIKPLLGLLTCQENETISTVLEGIENILYSGRKYQESRSLPKNPACEDLEKAGGIKIFEECADSNSDISENARIVLKEYFGYEDDF